MQIENHSNAGENTPSEITEQQKKEIRAIIGTLKEPL